MLFSKIRRKFLMFLAIVTLQTTGFIASSWASPFPQSSIDLDKPPKITLVRKLPVNPYFVPFVNLASGTAGLTWSADGKFLAAYTKYHQVLEIWTSFGVLVHQIQLYEPSYLPPPILAFTDGAQKLVLTPSSLRQSDAAELNRTMMTILNLSDPFVLTNIDGDKPLGTFRDNHAVALRISSDQTLAAILAGSWDDRRQVSVYATADWHLIRVFRDTVMGRPDFVSSIAFSPDSQSLAIGRHEGQIQIYSLLSGTLTRTIDAFPDVPMPKTPAAGAVSFSPDSRLLAVGGIHGGGYTIVDGVRRPAVPSDPVRIFDVRSGHQIASVSGFASGLWTEETNSFVWSPRGGFLAFVSGEGDLHLWDPYHPSRPQGIVAVGRNVLSLAISPDGATIAVGDPSAIILLSVEQH